MKCGEVAYRAVTSKDALEDQDSPLRQYPW